jgi:hypothetical protein
MRLCIQGGLGEPWRTGKVFHIQAVGVAEGIDSPGFLVTLIDPAFLPKGTAAFFDK